MSDLFKVPIVSYWLQNAWIDAAGNPCEKGTPGARVSRNASGSQKERRARSSFARRARSGMGA